MRALMVLVLILCACRGAQPSHPETAPMWSVMKSTLVGSWHAPLPGGGAVKESFRVLSNESVLVESFTTASGKETLSVYHPNRSELLLTHYCAQGNQPRLRAEVVSDRSVTFRFLDATNVLPDQAVLIEKTLSFDGSTIEQTETYRSPDGTLDKTTYRFVRD